MLLYIIRDSGLDLHKFDYLETPSGSIIIEHKASDYGFSISIVASAGPKNAFYISYSPGTTLVSEMFGSLSWDSLTSHFTKWLTNVARELAEPDLWKALVNYRIPANIMGAEENTAFSEQERATLEERLKQIRDYARRVQPSLEDEPEPSGQLEAKIDYLIESSTRMGRKDWLNIFVGVIFSIAVTLLPTGEAAKDFVEFAWRVINQVMPSLPS